MSTDLTPTPPGVQDPPPNPVPGWTAREPALVRGLIVAVVGAAVSFGLHLTDEQRSTTIDVLTYAALIVLPLIQAAWTRAHVSPVAQVAAKDDDRGVTRAGPAAAADDRIPEGSPVDVLPAVDHSRCDPATCACQNPDPAAPAQAAAPVVPSEPTGAPVTPVATITPTTSQAPAPAPAAPAVAADSAPVTKEDAGA